MAYEQNAPICDPLITWNSSCISGFLICWFLNMCNNAINTLRYTDYVMYKYLPGWIGGCVTAGEIGILFRGSQLSVFFFHRLYRTITLNSNFAILKNWNCLRKKWNIFLSLEFCEKKNATAFFFFFLLTYFWDTVFRSNPRWF